jgi:iron-sulfur cluster repair protein YtfE (RIC family)
MPNLMKLRREHARLSDIIQSLASFVMQPRPPEAEELFKVRNELTSTLIRHLKAEDWVLYPRLIANSDPTVAGTALAFSDEMGGLADAYRAYVNKWTAISIAYDWSAYCEETRAVIEALTNRINRENRDLYPLVEALDQAA